MKMLTCELFSSKRSPHTGSFPYSSNIIRLPEDCSDISIHWHEDMEIIRILDGHGTASADLERFCVRPGDICLILPNQLHSVEPQEGQTLKIECIRFSLRLLTGAQEDGQTDRYFLPLLKGEQLIPWLVTPEYSWYPAFSQCLDEAGQLCTFYPAAYPLAVKSRLFQLFYILFFNEPRIQPKSRPQKSVDKTKQIISYITEHYREHLTMEQMARVCGFSESHFMKFFKSAIGITFTECLNNYRLSRAAELLSGSHTAVSEIAGCCGFDNISYFNRLFKRKYGVTPSVYRKHALLFSA